MRLVWTASAQRDRDAIYDHIEARNPSAAAKLDARFGDVAERLRRRPGIGRPGRVPGTREFVAHPSYVLVYEWIEDAVCILALVHTSRRWPPDSPGQPE